MTTVTRMALERHSDSEQVNLTSRCACTTDSFWSCKIQERGKRRRRRRNRRRKSRNRVTLLELACRNSTQMESIRKARSSHTRTSGSVHLTVDIFTDFVLCLSNAWRTTSEEKRYNERMANEDPETTYQSIRRGAEVHRIVRKHARKHIRPGMTMTEIVENIEDGTRALVEENGLESGVGFPTGVSLNNCAAHYTPNAGDTTGLLSNCLTSRWLRNLRIYLVLQRGDVLKVDIGVHVKGRILDSAFTLTWEPTYDKLIEAVKAATDTGIRVS